MPSPFPGMNPWLESRELFPEFHDALIQFIRVELNQQLPTGYVARSKNRIYVESERYREPDVSLLTPAPPSRNGGTALVDLAGLESLGVVDDDEVEESHIEVYATNGMRLVTAIELLSRTNKASGKEYREVYQTMQKQYVERGVHLVEIDLLRFGHHTTLAPYHGLVHRLPSFDYHVSVRTASPGGRLFAKPFRLSDPLPAFGLPLDPALQPVMIDLQPLLHRTYDTGRFDFLIDYTQPCDPPLTPEQQAWADGILRTTGGR